MFPRLAATLLTLLSLSSSAVANDSENQRDTALRWQTAECKEFRANLPADLVQGFVEVPEIWGDAKSPQIKVFYYGRIKAGETPVAYFNGGPSYYSHARYRDFAREKSLAGRTMIFIDQRGTGCSTAYPEATPENMPRFPHWTSRAIVQDAEAVRKTLFKNARWIVFGNSYGGLIVRRYLEVAPDGLERVVSHGFSPTTSRWAQEPRTALAVENQREFVRLFPAMKDDLPKVNAYLGEHCFKAPARKVCRDEIFHLLAIAMSYVSEWPELAEDFHALVHDKNSAKAFRKLGEKFYLNDLRPTEDISRAAQIIGLLEIEPEREECVNVNRRLAAAGIAADQALFANCSSASARWTIESRLPADPVRVDLIKAALAARPALKFLVFAGAKDAIVPPELFVEEAKALGDLEQLEVLPNSGHDGYRSERKVAEAAFGPLPGWSKPHQ